MRFRLKYVSHNEMHHELLISQQSDKVVTLDIATADFTSTSFFPHNIETSNEPLVHGFISSNRVADLVTQYKLAIVQNIMPGLRKDGYTEETGVAGTAPSSSRNPPPARPHPVTPPTRPEIPFGPQPVLPNNPLEIGRQDREPFARNPFAPPSLFPPGSGDGMFVGPDHPIFGPRRDMFGEQGPWGGDGYLPPLGAPPGARFDPVGPGPVPRRGGSGPRRGGPPGWNVRGPDNDEFMPPGAGDMFL